MTEEQIPQNVAEQPVASQPNPDVDMPVAAERKLSKKMFWLVGAGGLVFLLAVIFAGWFYFYKQIPPQSVNYSQESRLRSDAESAGSENEIDPLVGSVGEDAGLSAMVIQADDELELLVVNEEGKRTGVAGQNSFEEIPNAHYGRQLPIQNYKTGDKSANAHKEFEITQAQSGDYKVLISAKSPGTYQLSAYAMDVEGNSRDIDLEITFDAPGTKEFLFKYDRGVDNFVAEFGEIE